jgi:hypothetical protein
MAKATKVAYAVRRAHPRYSFAAEAELILHDGKSLSGQLTELSSRGCYVDASEPLPLGTEVDLNVCHGVISCELHGKVIYEHSGGGLGVTGMGVVFERMGAEQHYVVQNWIMELSNTTPQLPISAPRH